MFDELRIELCVGQYLDLVGTASASRDPAQAARASSGTSRGSTRSSGRCTSAPRSPAGSTSCVRPAQRVGCRSARRSSCATTCSACSATSDVTGKPVGDDLREGKLTPLVALAADRAGEPDDRALLDRLGAADLDADEIAGAAGPASSRTGARRRDRSARSNGCVGEARAALDAAPITRDARRPLGELAALRRLARPLTPGIRRRTAVDRLAAPMTAGAAPAIEVAGLVKRYGGVRAVDGLSFASQPGEVFGLLGPNGAGKTTTVEILEGYRAPDAGTVRVLGLDPVATAPRCGRGSA